MYIYIKIYLFTCKKKTFNKKQMSKYPFYMQKCKTNLSKKGKGNSQKNEVGGGLLGILGGTTLIGWDPKSNSYTHPAKKNRGIPPKQK